MATEKSLNNVHIIRLTLSNFGPFRDISVEFSGAGVTAISGPNASGKSQLLGAIVAAIVGRHSISIDLDGCGPSHIKLELKNGGFEEVAALTVAGTTSRGVVGTARPEVTHASSPIAVTLLEVLKKSAPPRVLIRDDRRIAPLNRRELVAFERIAPPDLIQNDFWQSVRASGWLESGAHSAGVGSVIDIVREFIARADVDGLPLMVDGIFSQLDARAAEFCAELLRMIGLRSQVIVVMPSYAGQLPASKVITLPARDHALRAMAHYSPAALPVIRSKSSDKGRQKAFKFGERFPLPENRVCELKEIKGRNPVGSIGQIVDQYVVAFLNAGVDQIGSIFWGVTDDTRTVVGVPLTDAQCDEVRRVVVEKVGGIMPPVAPTALDIEFHSVTSTNSVPLYVVEVRVPAFRGECLYATGSEDVYVKTEAGKKRLTIMQIQQELLRRMNRM